MNKFIPSVLVTLIAVFFLARYSYPAYSSARQQHQELVQKVTQLQSEVSGLPQEQMRNVALKKELEAFQSQLPNDEELPDVLSSINTLARQLQIQPGRLTRTVTSSSVPGVSAVNLNLELTGTYARVQALIQSMSRLKRAYTTTSIRIASAEIPGTVTATLAFTTYKRDSAEAQPATPATGSSLAAEPTPMAARKATPGGNP